MCGLSRPCDILTANELKPDYVGFVFASGSKRHVSAQLAARLKCLLDPAIKAVGVFVNESPEIVAQLLDHDTVDAAQLHGNEDEAYIAKLRKLTDKPIIKAFRIASADDMRLIDRCSADYVLLDSGAGTGTVFDWSLANFCSKPFFLAGGLDAENVAQAVARLHPFAVDVSSGIESAGVKDKMKMAAFVTTVRKGEKT